jgi:hypothetical protein
MSSFLHSSTHFNSVEKSLFKLISDNSSYYLPYSIKEFFVDCYNKNQQKGLCEINDFMNTIRNISVLCTNLQYKNHDTVNLDADIEYSYQELITNTKNSIKLSDIDLLKALQSINYQIEINHLTNLRSLTKKEEVSMFILNELINSIAIHIVTNTTEYNNSKGWSL